MLSQESSSAAEPTPTLTLISALLMSFSWTLSAVVYLGQWFFGPVLWAQVVPPHKRQTALVVSIVLSLFHAIWGRRSLRRYRQASSGRIQVMSLGQAALVVVIVIVTGLFGTWLFVNV